MSFGSLGPAIALRLSGAGGESNAVPPPDPAGSTTVISARRVTTAKGGTDGTAQIHVWLEEIFDRLAAGIFLVQRDACIVHANASGRAILAHGDVVRDSNGKLSATEPDADRALRRAFASVRNRDEAAGRRGMAISLSALSGVRFVAHVLRLRAGNFSPRIRAARVSTPLVVVSLRKATLDLASSANALVSHYRLTAAELRVSMAIAEVGGVPEVAQLLGICETTVKTHLQHVFDKTGTNRQADLVKLVAGFVCPFD